MTRQRNATVGIQTFCFHGTGVHALQALAD